LKVGLLPQGFRFSQASLATAEACARRFYLRYLARLRWPAAADPVGLAREKGAARGRLFHHLVLQHTLGLPVAAEVEAQQDPVLARWWRHFLQYPPPGVPQGRVFVEIELWVPLGPWRLRARFDQVVLDERGDLCILDWKTGSPPPQGYLGSWQTRVYAFAASEGGALFTGSGPVVPEQVSLCYWQAAHPAAVQWYRHRAAAHAEVRAQTEALASRLADYGDREQFELTTDRDQCRTCEFRAYCGRGEGVGPGWEHEEEEGEGDEGLAPPLEAWG
jgi:hypothetical protein